MAKIFKTLLDKAIDSGIIKKHMLVSTEWFYKQMEKTNIKFDPATLIASNRKNHRKNLEVGKMYLYKYDPKLQKELPYYDVYPLVIITKITDDGFYGINFHYLQYNYRAQLLDNLMLLANSKTLDEKTRLLVTYKLLAASARYENFKPCFKKYLFDHIDSKFLFIDSSEWNVAMFLPLEKFESQKSSFISRRTVWDESKNKI